MAHRRSKPRVLKVCAWSFDETINFNWWR